MTSGPKRVAWITGGGSGIGRAGAEALYRDGWTVIVSGRRPDVLQSVVDDLGGSTSGAELLPLDVTDPRAVHEAAQSILAKHGQVDLLVNNAGLNIQNRSWSALDISGWNTIVNANLNGVLYCLHAVLPSMRARRSGSVINVASWAGHIVTQVTGPAYTATKHAVVALTHSFNMDECRYGLRACCLSPGEVATPIMKARPSPPSEEDTLRMLQPEDLGRTIAFVANLPAHVCMNDIIISPTHNRVFLGST